MLSDEKWSLFSIMRKNEWICTKCHIHVSCDTDNFLTWDYFLAFFVIIQQSFCLCLAIENGFRVILRQQINELKETSYIEVSVCVEVLRPSQLNRAMLSTVNLRNYTFTEQAWSSKRLTSIVHIRSP